MQKGARLAEDIAAVGQLLDGSAGGLSLLRQAARRLERIGGEHERLDEALAALDRALVEASDAEDCLAGAADALAFDPQRLEEAETRLVEIRALARKHRVEPDALPALADHLAGKLADLEAGE
jgi:DNA repair protein RecN (Recombination protein N)